MKKLVYKLMLGTLVTAVAAPFFLHDRDGRPLMSVARLRAPQLLPDGAALSASLDRLAPETTPATADAAPAETVAVYRWQDDNGVWHLSDRGAADRDSTALTVAVDRDVVSAAPAQPPAADADSGGEPLLQAADTLEQARQAGRRMERHYRALDM